VTKIGLGGFTVTDWAVLWKPPGYRPVSENGIKSLCDGDSEPALLAMRSEALIIKQVDHQWESSK
jgi:hypothetical protein